MAATDLGAVADQVKTIWSPILTKELRENTLLPSLVNKDYEGDIRQQNDTVRVSQVNKLTGQLLTVGTNADSFDSETMSMSHVDIKADKRAVAAYEIQDLVHLQSQLDKNNPEILDSLKSAIETQINNHLYSLVAPSTSSPDHSIASVTDFNNTALAAYRVLAAKAHWNKLKPWYCLVDPQYYADLLATSTFGQADYGAADAPLINGQFALKRYGFNILEDDSDGILTISPTTNSQDSGLLFHPDFLHLVMQTEVEFKLSDMHASKKFGYVLSASVVFGGKLGIDGNLKHIEVYNT